MAMVEVSVVCNSLNLKLLVSFFCRLMSERNDRHFEAGEYIVIIY